jgi:hypothetical protein
MVLITILSLVNFDGPRKGYQRVGAAEPIEPFPARALKKLALFLAAPPCYPGAPPPRSRVFRAARTLQGVSGISLT